MIVHPHLIAGGAEKQLLYLARYLCRVKHEVSVAVLSDELKEGNNLADSIDLIKPKTEMKFRHAESALGRYIYTFRALHQLQSLVKTHHKDFDILNPHNFPASLSCLRLDKPVVWMCNEAPGFFGYNKYSSVTDLINTGLLNVERTLVNRFIGDICVIDNLNKTKIWNRYGRIAHVVFSGVDYEFYKYGNPEKARSRYCLDNAFVVLQVGRIVGSKNQMRSISAVERLHHKIPNIRLVIAGRDDTYYARKLKSYVTNNGLDKYVLFTGTVSDEDIRDLYHACDVNIFPTKLQTWGLAPLEGLCAKKLPIVSPLCGVSEFIIKNNLGIVSNDLESSILRIFEMPENYYDMVEKANHFVRDHLSWEVYASRMLEIFMENYDRKTVRLGEIQ